MDESVTFRKGMTVWLKPPGEKYDVAGNVVSTNNKNGTVLVSVLDRAYCDRREKVIVVTPTELRKRVLPNW